MYINDYQAYPKIRFLVRASAWLDACVLCVCLLQLAYWKVSLVLPVGSFKNEDDLKNEDNLKNEDDLKKEDYFKNEDK